MFNFYVPLQFYIANLEKSTNLGEVCGKCHVIPSSIPKWAPVRPIRGPFGAQLCPTGAHLGPKWNAAWDVTPSKHTKLELEMPRVTICVPMRRRVLRAGFSDN